jgi:hypothetical protein
MGLPVNQVCNNLAFMQNKTGENPLAAKKPVIFFGDGVNRSAQVKPEQMALLLRVLKLRKFKLSSSSVGVVSTARWDRVGSDATAVTFVLSIMESCDMQVHACEQLNYPRSALIEVEDSRKKEMEERLNKHKANLKNYRNEISDPRKLQLQRICSKIGRMKLSERGRQELMEIFDKDASERALLPQGAIDLLKPSPIVNLVSFCLPLAFKYNLILTCVDAFEGE